MRNAEKGGRNRMSILFINASPNKNGNTAKLVKE